MADLIQILGLIVLTGCNVAGEDASDGVLLSESDTTSEVSVDNASDISVDKVSIDNVSSYQLQKTTLHVDRRGGINGSPCSCFYHAMAYADFDGDGDVDIFLSGGNGTDLPSAVEIHLNDGAGNFTLDKSLIHGSEPGVIHPRKAILGDYNGDDQLDILVVGHGYDQPPFPGERPLLFLTTANGLEYSTSLEAYSGFFHSAASADIDNDGDLDILIGDTKVPFMLINDALGGFTQDLARLTSELNNQQFYTSELIDIDQDGYIDLIAAGHEFETMATVIYWGSASGTYLATNKTLLPEVVGQGVILDIDAEDLDGDGRSDIVLTRTGGGNDNFYVGYYLQLIENNGDRQFSDSTSNIAENSSTENGWIDWIRIQDYNSDGYLDIIEDNNSPALVWLNNGNGEFTR